MASRILIFDPNGNMLDELSASTVRSWVLGDYGRCTFTLATSDPKCTPRNLNYGNLVLIQHIPSFTGGKLPDWVGVIVPPRTWGINKIEVNIYSAEYVLLNRAMPDDTITDTAGGIFWELLNNANDEADNFGAIEIQPGSIDTSGPTHTEVLKLSAHEHAQSISKLYGNDYDVTPQLNNDGSLSLMGNYYSMKGVNTQAVLQDGISGNIEFVDNILVEQGTLGNAVIGYGSDVSPKQAGTGHGHRKRKKVDRHNRTRRVGEDWDSQSINQYGLFESNQVYSVSGLGAIHTANLAFLDANAQPVMTFSINALDVGDTFSNLDLGNVLNLQMSSTGFFNNRQLGFNDWVRIDAMEYDDLQNKVKLIKHIYRPPRNRSGIQIPIGY